MTEEAATFQRGPYIQAALFCERVLDEKDNVKSLIRIVDRLQIQVVSPDLPAAMPEVKTELTAVLMLKSGEAIGPVPLRITLTGPSGITETQPVWEGTVHLEGGTRGHNLILRLRTSLREPGPYWYNVYIGDRLATKMPYEVVFTAIRGTGQAPEKP